MPDDARLYGAQRPRIETVPPFVSSSGQEAVELAASAGVTLDPWQEYCLHVGLGEKADGSWSAFEIAVNVARQNGKGGVIEARELAGLYLLNEPLIIHSAHEFKTALEAFRRIESLITNYDHLRKRVARVRRTTGEEAIELLSGQRLRFLARSGGSGRGFTGKTLVLDEDMILGDDAMGALMPTLAAVEDPQVWYFGSAGIGALSVQLARLRRRALAAIEAGVPDESLAYLEWSIAPHTRECPPGCTDHDDPAAPESVARANPALGYRLSLEHTERERRTMAPEIYARERLGVGDYPSDDGDAWAVISKDAWEALIVPESGAEDPVAFALDVTPERSHASICVAGPAPGGDVHLEVVDNRPGVAWVEARVEALTRTHGPRCWVIDEASPAGSLLPAVRRALRRALLPEGEELPEDEDQEQDEEPRLAAPIVPIKAREYAQACGQFYDAVAAGQVVHLGQAPLATALAGARKRDLGEAWAWSRRSPGVDISPLVGVTNARWGLDAEVEVEEEDVEPWAEFA
ncbi:terminase [Streptomyces sp. NPDC059477]|uniref:terminase n=1 Tax=Streptomyces sp. NPDC059477 TaxID=3346847 RepID=UPI0036B86C20